MIMSRMPALLRSRAGNALVSAIIVAGIISGVGVVMLNRATASVRQIQISAEADQSWYLAMAGIEHAMARLRWDGTSWNNLAGTPITVSGSMNGGTYTATATRVVVTTGRIVAVGRHGRFTRRLIGVVQWQNDESSPGSMALFGGGNWRFSGNSHIVGNIATTGNIIFAGSSTLCGQAHARGTVTPEGAAGHLEPGCGSVAVSGSQVVTEYSDTYPSTPTTTGDVEITSAADSDISSGFLHTSGKVTISGGGSGITFTDNVTILADNGIVVSTAVKAADGKWVKLYTKASYGGSLPCTPPPGSGNAGDVGSRLSIWVDQKEHHDVIFWAPNGMIYFKGSMGGGASAGVYGKVYGKCVQTSDNWNFYPGSDMPGGTCTVGCASSLRLTALYEN